MTPAEKMTKARAGLVRDQPFFGALALRLRLEANPAVPLAGTDGTRMAYNPDRIADMALDQVKFLIAHEVMHCAMGHPWRRGGRDFEKWNIAGDYAINQILVDAGVGDMPPGGLIDPQYKGMAADAIYGRLGPDPENGEGSTGTFSDPPPGGQPGDGKPDPNAAPDPNALPPPQSGTRQPGPPDPNGQPGQPDPNGPPPPLSEQDWKLATAQVKHAERARGTLSGEIDRATRDAMRPLLDWRVVLRAFLLPDRSEYSWSRPNRRYIAQGLYLPGPDGREARDIVCAVDTSGSVTPAELEQVAGELTAILEDFPQTTLRVVYCDYAIKGAQDFTIDNLPLVLEAAGGGGTSFVPVFDWIEEQEIDPAALVYLTDMAGVFPDAPPEYPVLWISSGGDSAPFGEVIQPDW